MKKFKVDFLLFGVLLFTSLLFLTAGCSLPGAVQEQQEQAIGSGATEGENDAEVEELMVVLIIDDGEVQNEFEGTVADGTNAFDFMRGLADEGMIQFDYDESSVGVFVKSINGIENDMGNNLFWMFYVNDTLSGVGVSDYVLENGDVVSWRYVDTSEMSFE